MKNKLVLGLLFLPVFVLGAMMAYYDYATHFSRVEVVVEGYDPKDFFSGFYMELQPAWDKTDCTQFEEQKCPQEAFLQRYKYYINHSHSNKLTSAVNAGVVKLVFSYSEGRTPYIVDLLIDGKSYLEFVTTERNNARISEQMRQHHQAKGILHGGDIQQGERPAE